VERLLTQLFFQCQYISENFLPIERSAFEKAFAPADEGADARAVSKRKNRIFFRETKGKD